MSVDLPDPIGDAVRWLRDGGLLAYPTETVWGLGALAVDDEAVERLRRWKGRSEDVPLSILVEDADSLAELGIELDARAGRLTAAFWPGPLTLVLASRARFARGVARDDGAVGVRCSAHPLASALARRLRREGVGPVTSTSLNPSGEPPASVRKEAERMCHDGPDAPRLIPVEGAEAGGGGASTVVDLTGEEPVVVRWGGLREEELLPVLERMARA